MTGGRPTTGSVLRRSDRFPSRVVESEMIAVDVAAREILHLDPIATWVVERMDGTRTLGQILDGVLEAFDVDEGTARADVMDLVGTLLDQGFLELVGDRDAARVG